VPDDIQDSITSVDVLSPEFDALPALGTSATPVVVCLDVGHSLQQGSGSGSGGGQYGTESMPPDASWAPRRFAKALVARRPRMVVFAAATPGEGAWRSAVELTPARSGAFELQQRTWVTLFEELGYRMDELRTVMLRNGFLNSLSSLGRAYWLPKNALVFRVAPVAGSAEADAWQRSAEMVVRNRAKVQWFDVGPAIPDAMKELLVADALEYQHLIVRCCPATVLDDAPPVAAPAAAATAAVGSAASVSASRGVTPAMAALLQASADGGAAPRRPSAISSAATVQRIMRDVPAADASGFTPDSTLLQLYAAGDIERVQVALLRDLAVLKVA
jgi:hypothetical protein